MAVAENAPKFDDTVVVVSKENDLENPKPRNDSSGVLTSEADFQPKTIGSDGDDQRKNSQMGQMQNGFVVVEANGVNNISNQNQNHNQQQIYGLDHRDDERGNNGDESFKQDMRDLEYLLSKLNPMAEEFVPPSLGKIHGYPFGGAGFGYAGNLSLPANNSANANGLISRKNSYIQGKRRNYYKLSPAQREAMIRRTVYVSDIDQQVTEENLAALFLGCGQVVDCRVCGDPNSILRFAFVEFTDEEGARAALTLSGTMLGYYPVRVLPSKTAIAPVNPTFLPRSDDEREMCSRTIYCTNIDKMVTQADVKLFFESLCGEVQRLRLLGDYHHSTRIAFVEFTMAESAIAALNCSGVVLGTLPIRVSPSKTPVRPRSPRPMMH
ncbi:hypothetical protein TIFTF001_013507 [Ficus carica]|uniref:RRM domain-containing protein n=1 Tax=Ficus carica TaxID=3494 RepID=A0AA88A134_FICCA|nr:hypothetical protein TIFTF001_013507 [Ficus carica]